MALMALSSNSEFVLKSRFVTFAGQLYWPRIRYAANGRRFVRLLFP